MSKHQLTEADLRFKYKRRLELSFVLSLSLVTLIFYSFTKNNTAPAPLPKINIPITAVITPPTKQLQRPPRPPRPTIPVASEDEKMPDDVQLAKIFDPEIDFDIKPPEQEEIEETFNIWENLSEKPVLIHKETPIYPELAQKAGIEGRVTVMVVISKKGKVISASLMSKENMLSDAALAAAMKCIFKPAKQFDKYVKVKMTIPFEFRLR